MSQMILSGSDELELFYKKKFYFSYSGINKLLFSPGLFYNHYILNNREDSTDTHLIAGRVLHCLLLEPGNYDKQFITMPGKFPTDSQKKIIDTIFKQHLVIGNDTLDLSDYSDDILTQLITNNLYQTLKTDQQRLDKVLTEENKEYFEFLKKSLNKTVVDQTILDGCNISVEILRRNVQVRALLQLDPDDQDDSVKVYNELHLKTDIEELPFGFHGVLDNVVVDYNLKTIFINDLKTLGKSIQDFPDSVEYYKYWIQAVIYVILAKKEFAINKDWNVQVTFIVIDKYNQVYPYQVSTATLAKWESDFEEIVTTIKWHYENKRYDLPYELALGNVKL
jgi:hypothetical protein